MTTKVNSEIVTVTLADGKTTFDVKVTDVTELCVALLAARKEGYSELRKAREAAKKAEKAKAAKDKIEKLQKQIAELQKA